MIVLVYALLLATNMFDAWATINVVCEGSGVELNPIMAAALAHGPAAFFATKMVLVVCLAGFLAVASARHRLAWGGLRALAVVYLLLLGWHVSIVIFGPALALPT